MSKLGYESPRLKIILNLMVLVFSLYGVSKKDFSSEQTPLFDSILVNTFAPMQRMVVYSKGALSSFFDHYIFIVNAGIENDSLKKKIQELENIIFQME